MRVPGSPDDLAWLPHAQAMRTSRIDDASGISSANATSSRGGSERLSSASTQRLHIHLNHEVTQAHQAISSSLPVMEAGLVRAQLELYAEEQANMLYRGKDDNSGSVETTTGDATASAVAQWQPEFDQKDKSANIASRVWCPEIDTVTRPSKNPPSWIPEVHCEGKSAPAGPIPAGLVAERRLQRGVHAPRTRNAIQVQQPTLHPAEEPANCRAENPAQKPVSNDLGDFQHDNRPSHLSDLALRIGESRPRQQDEGPFNSARWSQDEMLTPSTCPNSADDPWMDAEPQRPYNSNPVISVQRNDAEATCVKNAEKQNAEVISVQGKDAEAEASDTKPEVDVAEAKATEIWTGLGGFGRRRETPGCNGRYPKCELKKSPHCALRVLHAQPTRVEFLFAVDLVKHENVTTLSHETVLKMKGRRIEMVQPNGTHVWLWGVHPPAIREIFTAFESMNTYQRQSTAHKLVDPPNVGFQGKSIEIPPSSARILRSQMASHHHPQHEDGCEVELGFAPAGTPHGGKSTPHSEFTSTVLRSALVQSDEPTCLHPEVSKDVKIESRGRQGDPCQAMKSLHRNRIIIPSLTGAKGKPFIPLLPLERLKEPEPFSMAQVSFHLSTPDSSDQLTGSSGAALDTADRNHFASNRLSSSTSEKVTLFPVFLLLCRRDCSMYT